MEPLFLPVLHSFENNNIFTGSYGALRFRVLSKLAEWYVFAQATWLSFWESCHRR